MTKIPLWNGEVPYYNSDFGSFKPSLTPYLLENNKNASCVIVIPGGAYSGRADGHEGDAICKMLNDNGISAFILNYRVAPYKHPVMETDAKRAVRLVKCRASEFGVNPEKIGIIGFSAGGHLAAMTALRFDNGTDNGDEIDRISSRPDTAALCYAVNSLKKPYTHEGTLRNLLGDSPSDEDIFSLSAENIVGSDTPPVFMWHTAADNAVPVECSIKLSTALSAAKIPFEMHIFPFGSHGLGLAENQPLACEWSKLYIKWLKYYGY